MSKQQQITKCFTMDNISNNIEILIINELYCPLDNLPPSLTKIIIHKQKNILRSQHKIPYNCELIIRNVVIDDTYIDNICFNKINFVNLINSAKEEDYDDILEIDLILNELDDLPENIQNFKNLFALRVATYGGVPKWIINLSKLKFLRLEPSIHY